MLPDYGDEFTVDFGEAGSFEYTGGPVSCQMAGIHTLRFEGADGTILTMHGQSQTPLMETAVGTVLTLTSVEWDRTAPAPAMRADRFSGMGEAVVVSGGPFGAVNAFDPVKVCVYMVSDMNNINTGETAAFPTPMAFACRNPE